MDHAGHSEKNVERRTAGPIRTLGSSLVWVVTRHVPHGIAKGGAAKTWDEEVSAKDWLLTPAFVLLLCADAFATFLYWVAWALAYDKSGSGAWHVAMIVSWVAVVLSLLWINGRAIVRLPLAAGPILIIVYMLAQTTFVEGNYCSPKF